MPRPPSPSGTSRVTARDRSGAAAAWGRRDPDASVWLLRDLVQRVSDDGYDAARASGTARRLTGRGAVLVVGLGVLGLLLTVAVLQTRSSAPAVAQEKQELIDRVHAETRHNDRLQARARRLQQDVTRLQGEQLARTSTGQELQQRLTALGILAGTGRVRGPGLRIVVDDSPASDATGGDQDPGGRILDIDLQHLVNGLWSAGAEAIAINGQRLTALTAIRGADRSITVDYRPLARPYVVTAIGDPKTMQARFVESPDGAWMLDLRAGHGIRFDVTPRDSLTLPPESGAQIHYARTEGAP